jgi:hypothetical protein
LPAAQARRRRPKLVTKTDTASSQMRGRVCNLFGMSGSASFVFFPRVLSMGMSIFLVSSGVWSTYDGCALVRCHSISPLKTRKPIVGLRAKHGSSWEKCTAPSSTTRPSFQVRVNAMAIATTVGHKVGRDVRAPRDHPTFKTPQRATQTPSLSSGMVYDATRTYPVHGCHPHK